MFVVVAALPYNIAAFVVVTAVPYEIDRHVCCNHHLRRRLFVVAAVAVAVAVAVACTVAVAVAVAFTVVIAIIVPYRTVPFDSFRFTDPTLVVVIQ